MVVKEKIRYLFSHFWNFIFIKIIMCTKTTINYNHTTITADIFLSRKVGLCETDRRFSLEMTKYA